MARVEWVAVLVVGWLLWAAQAGSRPSELYRDEFKQRPDAAVLSKEFSGDAWIVLLYASRQGSAEQAGGPDGDPTDEAMERLRGEVKTDGEWLFWYRLSSWSGARQAQVAAEARGGRAQVQAGVQTMQDADACRSALMLANRARVMKAVMPACEPAAAGAPGRTP